MVHIAYPKKINAISMTQKHEPKYPKSENRKQNPRKMCVMSTHLRVMYVCVRTFISFVTMYQ